MDFSIFPHLDVFPTNTLAKAGEWGTMTAYKDFRVGPVPLSDAVDELKTVPDALYRVAEAFFG